MMSQLTQLQDEVTRLYTIYEEHKDSENETLRRKVHLDLDRFLMEHREVAAMLMISGLQAEIDMLVANKKPPKSVAWYKRIFKGGAINVNS